MPVQILKKNTYRDLPDAELIARYQKHDDQRCFDELFNRYRDKVFLICFKLLRNKEESQDACMEIFEKVRQAFGHDRVQSFNDWLFVIIKNHCYDKLRQRKMRVLSGDFSADGIEEILWKAGHRASLEEEMERRWRLAEVQKALACLDGSQKRCVELFYCQGNSYRAIAQETGYTLAQIKSYIQNGIRNLRLMLNQRED